jgi:phosphatidylcholine synthase
MQAPQHSPKQVVLAWCVHLFTASGGVFGGIALVAIAHRQFAVAAVMMLIALIIDSVDGSMARAVGVSQVLPDVDGRRLDDIIDFLNFVIVPCVFMVVAGNLTHWALISLPVLASSYGFSQRDAKTKDDFFLGFPSYWNVLAIYLWLLEISPAASAVWVVTLSVAVFIPLKYIYPSRLKVLRLSTCFGGLFWSLVLWWVVLNPEQSAEFKLAEITLLYPAYYMGLSAWLGRWNEGW